MSKKVRPLIQVRRALVVAVASAVAACAHAQSPAPDTLPPPAIVAGGTATNLANPDFERAMIVDSAGSALRSADAIKKLVAECRDNGFNTIIAQVRSYGDAFYTSSLVPKAAGLSADFDPLRTLITEAHAGPKPVKVVPMFVTFRVWSERPNVAVPDNHVSKKNPLWLTQNVDGATKLGDDGTELWLDPAIPEVQEHLALVAVDLVRNYEVDGILLDRMRYPDSTLKCGYSAAAVERFNKETGKSGKPTPNSPEWEAWRRDRVTETLKKIREAVKAAKPSLPVSVNSVAYGTPPATAADFAAKSDAFKRVFQDWVGWCQAGLVDTNYLMDYKSAERNGADFINWARFGIANRGKARVVVAVGGWLNKPALTAAMMLVPVFDPAAGGVAVSSYNSPGPTGVPPKDAFAVFAQVLNAPAVAAKAPQISGALAQGGADGAGALNAIALAAGLSPSTADPAAVGLPALSAALQQPPAPAGMPGLNAAAAQPTPPPGMPDLNAAQPTPVSGLPQLPPVAATTPAPSVGDVPAVGPSEMLDHSELTMPSLQQAAAPTPSLSPVMSTKMSGVPADIANRKVINIPTGAVGETNFRGPVAAEPGAYNPAKYEAPKLSPEKAQKGWEQSPMSSPQREKTDYSEPDSIFVPKQKTVGLHDYAKTGARARVSAVETPAAGNLEVIVLNSGKQFVGTVVERGPMWTVQLPNGSTVKLPGGRVSQSRPADAMAAGGAAAAVPLASPSN